MRLPGVRCDDEGTTFTVWTPLARRVEVALEGVGAGARRIVPLAPSGDGWFERKLQGVQKGALYMFVLDGRTLPDPFAKFLPSGVHGCARVEPSCATPALAAPPPQHRWVLYELHVGAFSVEGTYRGATDHLDALVDLGVTAIELMPVGAFSGTRGWGYDGVQFFAPHAPYGEPDDLRAFVRAAHARGLAVVLDVVYNHLGAIGNYLGAYDPSYLDADRPSPWGPSPNFANPVMRAMVMGSAIHWQTEYGFDGLRLDATHAIWDSSLLAALTHDAHQQDPPRKIFFEDERRAPSLMTSLGADAVWADDFHHAVHVLVTGERDGYYAAYEPRLDALAEVVCAGSSELALLRARGDDDGTGHRLVLPEELVYCVQNHDQIGNRPLGTRLHHDTTLDAFVAASMLLLFLPMLPLLFMGQEWAASSPFLYFTNHQGEFGRRVAAGRRLECATFSAFATEAARARIPDPEREDTFVRSKLDWRERRFPEHARVLVVHRAMLHLRRDDPVLGAPCSWDDLEVHEARGRLVVTRRRGSAERRLVLAFGNGPSPVASDVPEGWRVMVAEKSAMLLARS